MLQFALAEITRRSCGSAPSSRFASRLIRPRALKERPWRRCRDGLSALRPGPIARLCFRPASRAYGPASGLARRARTLLQTPPPATFRLMPRASLRCSGACRGAHASQGKFPVERLWERPNSVWALCGKKPVSASVQCAEAYGGIFY